ncbi:unnamed protein product [Pocillopora meandrina]|uniref:Uncharacterized protein n=1 Tax=Pocillopora meandrina TaxID=46732 RepID=A0AAU9W9A7_9CNID|nr:unnamed protein product [Pocillopora meandrina]
MHTSPRMSSSPSNVNFALQHVNNTSAFFNKETQFSSSTLATAGHHHVEGEGLLSKTGGHQEEGAGHVAHAVTKCGITFSQTSGIPHCSERESFDSNKLPF